MSNRAGRRQTDPTVEASSANGANLPALLEDAPQADPPSKASPAAGAFDAQLLGQPGVKRGLRGGEPVLNHARSAYLEAEYSGPADRRPPRGVLTRKDV